MSRKHEKIVEEAQKRFKTCEEWEANARANFVNDMKFANGDANNLWQYPADIANDRIRNNRPCLTINKTKQHCLQVINDQRQNQSQIEVRPVGDNSSYEAAKVFEGLIRHIENQSNAQAAYSNATYSQVISGIGYWRVVTDWAHDGSFDQEIFARRVQDPLSIYLDPNIEESDGSDARFAFVFKDMPRDEFEKQYGKDEESSAPLGSGPSSDSWDNRDTVRVCEYYRVLDEPDWLHELDNGDTVRESDVRDAGLLDQLKINSVRKREISRPKIEWYLIAGTKIIDKKDWAGSLIPIVRVIGEENVIGGLMDRHGMTRALVDPQRIYNFWSSSTVEYVALQSKTPFITDVSAISGFEQEWANANIQNKAYLPYNSRNEAGEKVDRPERAPPPVMSQAYLSGLQIAREEMMMASGQYEAQMGARSNEVSGTAVDARQRQGENATYHFIDRSVRQSATLDEFWSTLFRRFTILNGWSKF